MKEELIDVLDENGILTGEILPRSEVHKKGLWHRAILVAIVNENNQVLLQQRSFKKEKNAGMWDIFQQVRIHFLQQHVKLMKKFV